jgi:hypothetical protein
LPVPGKRKERSAGGGDEAKSREVLTAIITLLLHTTKKGAAVKKETNVKLALNRESLRLLLKPLNLKAVYGGTGGTWCYTCTK